MTDKTEAPTARRLKKAQEEGDSGASGFASQAAAFVAAVALTPLAVRWLALRAAADVGAAIEYAAHPGDTVRFDGRALAMAVVALTGPLLLAVGAVSLVFQVAQTGGVFTTRRLAFRFDRLDPFQGFASLFSGPRVFGVTRALMACAIVGWLAYRGIVDHLVDLGGLAGRPAWVGVLVSAVASTLAWRVALVGLLLGAVDLAVSRTAWTARLKMTKAEVRREHRDAEGDPHLKAARARAYGELVAQATIAGVKNASVVIVNPTHLACALRYDEKDGDEAPVVLASGEGELAARIVRAAEEAGVPVVRDIPLARALLELEVGTAIPEALYEAVAEILREIWKDGEKP
jgi:flagellar biosynthesis protein FlhB